MKKHIKRWAYFTVIGLIIVIAGCGTTNNGKTLSRPTYNSQGEYSTYKESDRRPQSPEPIDIMITIREWEIVQHRIIGDTYSLGNIRFTGRFIYIDDLVFKLKAENFTDCYWLVQIPSVQEGIYEIRAMPYKEYSMVLSPIDKLENIEICMKIQNKTITSHYIVNSEHSMGRFSVSAYNSPVLYLKNDQYPNRLWAAKLPKEDGTWTIYLKLIK